MKGRQRAYCEPAAFQVTRGGIYVALRQLRACRRAQALFRWRRWCEQGPSKAAQWRTRGEPYVAKGGAAVAAYVHFADAGRSGRMAFRAIPASALTVPSTAYSSRLAQGGSSDRRRTVICSQCLLSMVWRLSAIASYCCRYLQKLSVPLSVAWGGRSVRTSVWGDVTLGALFGGAAVCDIFWHQKARRAVLSAI